MGEQAVVRELAEFAEAGRGELPPEYFAYLDYVEAELVARRLPEPLLDRGGPAAPWFASAGPSILNEIRLLLCTDDPKHAHVRGVGRSFVDAAVPALAAAVASGLPLPPTAAAAAVAFLLLSVLRVGAATFCQAMEAGRTPS